MTVVADVTAATAATPIAIIVADIVVVDSIAAAAAVAADASIVYMCAS
jgi:hypothetical protein